MRLKLTMLRERLKCVVANPALCPAQWSAEALTRDDRKDALFSMPLVPGSLVACRATASASARLILSSAADNQSDRDESPLNSASIVHVQFSVLASRTPFTQTALLEICSAKLRPRYCVLHQHFSR